MNKEKIKCLNFLLKFHSLNLDELEWNERVELATDLDYFIRNDTISNPKTIIKNLVILDADDGFEFDETDLSIRGQILAEIEEIQNGFKSDLKLLIELIETTQKNAPDFKLERKFIARCVLSVKEGRFYLIDGHGQTINEILIFKFQKCMVDVLISYFYKCPECGVWFVNATKRAREYCRNKCARNFGMRRKRQEEKLANPEKYKEELKKGSKRARKSYVRKVQNGNPKIKVAHRPTKHKKGG